jgi:hypothetical protein
MKRILSISFICMAVLAMFSVSVMPHHHHDSIVCVIHHDASAAEGCNADDEHRHDAEDSGNCVAEIPYIDRAEREDKGVDCDSVSCGHDGHFHLFATALLYSDLLAIQFSVETDYGEYILPNYTVDARTGGGLRAPPAISC